MSTWDALCKIKTRYITFHVIPPFFYSFTIKQEESNLECYSCMGKHHSLIHQLWAWVNYKTEHHNYRVKKKQTTRTDNKST